MILNFRPLSKFVLGLLGALSVACGNTNKIPDSEAASKVQILDYSEINAYPHDTSSFTEGLLFHNGDLFESTGATADLPQTRSLFGKVDLATGQIEVKAELDKAKYFGEGITFLEGKVFQLTYKTKVGFIYDATSFKKIGEFNIPSKEGWGLTTDGTNLIMSDGTNVLTYLDPKTLKVIKTIPVSENGYVKNDLNELEFIEGFIYANIWNTNDIVKIDPADGNIIAKLDLTTLVNKARNIFPASLEMNGIAYNPVMHKVLVTGKLWPKIYEIKFSH